MVWETFSLLKGMSLDTMQIAFENCKFFRAITISEVDDLVLQVAIYSGSGHFEVTESNSTVATGRISILEKEQEHKEHYADYGKSLPTSDPKNCLFSLKEEDVYKELRLRGYEYK